MEKYPEFAEVNGKKYKINSDFRTAIRCNEIAENPKIGRLEKSLAIICILFGNDALDDYENLEKLFELALKFLACGKEIQPSNDEPDMSFVEDYEYIYASFMSDFKIDLDKENMHWWKFMKLMNGLSNSELGNCCVLNNIRNLRNFDESKIEDAKERQKIIEAKERVALKRNKEELTEEQLRSANELDKILGIRKE